MKLFLTFSLIGLSINIFGQENTGKGVNPTQDPSQVMGQEMYSGGIYPGGIYPGVGIGYGVKYDPCITNLNMAIGSYYFMDSKSPVKVDDNGKLIVESSKVKSFKENGNVKSIIFNTKNPYGGGETVHKIDVTEENGKITHVTRYEDTGLAKKWQAEQKSKGFASYPMLTKTELSFEHQDSGCKITSSEMTMEKDGKEEVKVTHDKKLCDDIAPHLNQMGKQNAMQCAGLFSQIEESFKVRNKELLKQGKELSMASMYGMSTDPDFGSKSRDWTMMSVISNCMMTENPMYPGMGFGIGMGYPGVGTNGGFGTGGVSGSFGGSETFQK